MLNRKRDAVSHSPCRQVKRINNPLMAMLAKAAAPKRMKNQVLPSGLAQAPARAAAETRTMSDAARRAGRPGPRSSQTRSAAPT